MSSTIGTKRQRVKDIPDSGIKPKRAKLGDRVVGHLPLQREKFKELFASLKTAKASKYFECIVAQLWNLLNPLRVQHKLSANFNPAVRKVDSIEGSDESANDLLWITRSYRKLVDELQFRLSSKSCKIASISLRFLFNGLRTESLIRLNQATPRRAFPLKLLKSIVESVLLASTNNFPGLLATLKTEFLEVFADVRFYVLPAVEASVDLLRKGATKKCGMPSNLSYKIFLLLDSLPIPTQFKHDAPFCSVNLTADGICRRKSDDQKIYQTAFVSAWCSYLQLDYDELCLTPAVYKEILTALPTSLLPFMAAPLKLAKFFLKAFQGEDVAVAVQAMSGLFYLLAKGRLGEPQLIDNHGKKFYNCLLSLLQPKVFSMPVRVRFLRLLRLSLQSKLLSTDLRAAFVKKLVAVSLLTSADASLWLLSVAIRMLQSGGMAMAPLIYERARSPDNQFKSDEPDPLCPSETPSDIKIPLENRILLWEKKESDVTTKIDVSANIDECISCENQGENYENRENLFRRMSLWEIEMAKIHWHPSLQRIADLFDTEIFSPAAPTVNSDEFISVNLVQLIVHELKGLFKRINLPQTIPIAANDQPITTTARTLLLAGCAVPLFS